MRKTLSLVLSIVMVLSLAIVGISAADATEIKTAEEFATMAADGNYKLGADITLAASYANPFTGTLDGNGHTVTVSAPMFAEFEGTVKNLTLAGSIDNTAAAAYTGAVAATVKGNAKFENITNNATIKGYLTDVDTTYRAGAGGIVGTIFSGVVSFTSCVNNAEITGHAVGGLVGSYDDSTKAYDKTAFAVSFTKCENNGYISATGSTKTTSAGSAGGIIGIANKVGYVYFTDCKNTGKVESDGACAAQAGGICGYIYTTLATDEVGEAIFNGCVNSGEIISADAQCGGITGWACITSEFTNCVNSGYVHSGKNAKDLYRGYCGGIAARTAGDSKNNSTTITNCLNTGNVESGRDQGAGIIAYHNGGNITFTNCTNSGTIKPYQSETNTNKVSGAGIFTHHAQNKYATSPVGTVTLVKCLNTGDIYATSTYCAGMVGYVYGTSYQLGILKECVNTGTLNVYPTGGFASHMIAYTNHAGTTYEDCIGAGKIVGAGDTAYPVVFGCSSAVAANYKISNYKLLQNDGTVWYSYATKADYAANVVSLADATTNGKFTLVTADEAKTAIAAIKDLGYQAPKTPDTGDSMIWVAVIALVSIMGMGIAVKARNN